MKYFVLYFTASGLQTVVGVYGETLEIPCYNEAMMSDDVLITKWKYVSHSGGQLIQNGEVRLTPTYYV